MKCIMKISDGSITRIADEAAKKKVESGAFKYVPKSEWKALKEPVVIDSETVDENVSTNDEKVHGLKAKDRRKANKK
jgi:hypothetical protein